MRMDFALRRAAAERGVSITRSVARRRGSQVSAAIFAAIGALALAGCNSQIPLPGTALLKPQPAPKCELRTDGNAQQQAPSASTTDADPDVASQTKLDYERQCYRHAEMIARNRLRNLQDSVQETIQALERDESGAAKAKE